MIGQSSHESGGGNPASSAPAEHRSAAPRSCACGVITVSDTRTIATDKSGCLIVESLAAAGHRVVDRVVVPDDPEQIRRTISGYVSRGDMQAVLITGGTGLSPRDQTFETVTSLLTKPLVGYGELFRMLSYEEIGAAAMLSRAVGGLIGSLVVFTMPGSTAGVRLALDKLILPELGHVVREATK